MIKKATNYWFVIPGVLLISFFLLIPLFTILLPTFFPEGFSLSGYTDFLADSYHLAIVGRTLGIALATTLICIILGVPTAYYISLTSTKVKGLLIAFCLFPLLTNTVIRNFAWITILGRNGVINNTLTTLGIVKEPLELLYTNGAIIVGSVYLFLPVLITTIIGVLDNIESDLIEAAMTLGSSPIASFVKVILPLSIPGILVGGVLVFTGTLTAYTTPLLLGGNRKMVIATLLQQEAMAIGNWQRASIIAFVMIVMTLLVTQVFNRLAKTIDKREEGLS